MKIYRFIKNTVYVAIILLFVYCKDKSSYLDKYPYFENVTIKQNTITLDNFKSKTEINGIQYILNIDGSLREILSWKNNRLNGVCYLFSRNGKIQVIANYTNDTLCGNYYLLDTLSGNPLRYAEKIKICTNWNYKAKAFETLPKKQECKEVTIFDNQVLTFNQGKLNNSSSYFYTYKKLDSVNYLITLKGRKKFRNSILFAIEHNEDTFIFDKSEMDTSVKSDDNKNFIYKVRNIKMKYLSGVLSNWRFANDEEINSGKAKSEDVLAKELFFKIDLQSKDR